MVRYLLSQRDKLFYGWVLVIAFLIIGTILYGTIQSFGVFFKSIESAFYLTRTTTSAVVSINMTLAGIAALVTGWTLDRYGPKTVVLLMGFFTGLSLLLTSLTNSPWQLFLTYGALLPLGTGAVYVVPTAVISRWFSKRRGLALGISGTGAGLGTIVIVPLTTYLVTSFSWRIGYIVIGLAAWIIIIPLSILMKRYPHEVGALADGVRFNPEYSDDRVEAVYPSGFPLSQVLRTRNFWFVIFIWVFFASCVFLVFTHLVPHITDIGFSPGEASGVLSTLGGAAIIGRILMGTAADRIGAKPTSIIASLLQAGAMVWLIWSQELWMLYMFAFVFGFAYSGFSSSMGAFIGDIFGLTQIGTIFGMLEISFGIGAAAGTALGGIIFDSSGNYLLAFIVTACFMMMAALFIGLLKIKTGHSPVC